MDMKNVLSFLTRIPIKSTDIEDAAYNQYLFPLVGMIIGFIASITGIISMRFFSKEIGALFTILSIYFVTGLIHLDGLSDFSDGLMASGSKQKKISAMKDVSIGIGGIFSVVFVLLTSFFVISDLGEMVTTAGRHEYIFMYQFGCVVIMSEVSAKLSMNTCIVLGREMSDGIGSLFINNSTVRKYCVAVALSVLVGIVLTGFYFIVVLTGLATAIVVVNIAHKNFGSVNGDALGASNEISRTVTLLIWMVIY
jgi:adenosylcobinamide-GDP ribazoletransferase